MDGRPGKRVSRAGIAASALLAVLSMALSTALSTAPSSALPSAAHAQAGEVLVVGLKLEPPTTWASDDAALAAGAFDLHRPVPVMTPLHHLPLMELRLAAALLALVAVALILRLWRRRRSGEGSGDASGDGSGDASGDGGAGVDAVRGADAADDAAAAADAAVAEGAAGARRGLVELAAARAALVVMLLAVAGAQVVHHAWPIYAFDMFSYSPTTGSRIIALDVAGVGHEPARFSRWNCPTLPSNYDGPGPEICGRWDSIEVHDRRTHFWVQSHHVAEGRVSDAAGGQPMLLARRVQRFDVAGNRDVVDCPIAICRAAP